MNSVLLSGNVVTKTKHITTTKGKKLTKWRFVNNRCIKRGVNGEDDKIESVYIGCTLWNKHVDLEVGDRLMVNGILRQDEFPDENSDDLDSQKQKMKNVYFLDVKEFYNLEKRPKNDKDTTGINSKYIVVDDVE